MKKNTITTAIAAVAMLTAGAASATTCETCEIDFNIYNSSVTQVAGEGGGQYKAWKWVCVGMDTGAFVNAVLDQTYAPDVARPGVIRVWPTVRGPHFLTDDFERENVEPACSEYLGEPALITNRYELVPNYGNRFDK